MISKTYIKDLGFDTIEDMFQYIEDSYINGQSSQFKRLCKKLSPIQYLAFNVWVNNTREENDCKTGSFWSKVMDAVTD